MGRPTGASRVRPGGLRARAASIQVVRSSGGGPFGSSSPGAGPKRLHRIAFKKVPQRWEPARVTADRLEVTESEFQELLALAYEDLLELQEEVQRALTSKELCRENELRAMIFRARSAALNIGAVRLARIIDVLRVSKIECDDLKIFADVLGSETNAAFGPIRALGAADAAAPQRSA